MDIIEDDNFLPKDKKQFIDKVILGANFNYFLSEAFAQKGYLYFSHAALVSKSNKHYSPHYTALSSLFYSFCNKHNLTVKSIHRININITVNINKKECIIHKDHPRKHKQLIIYLNDCDPKSCTLIYKNKKLIKIKPKKYKAVCFDHYKHSFRYPRYGMRAVAVYTFSTY